MTFYFPYETGSWIIGATEPESGTAPPQFRFIAYVWLCASFGSLTARSTCQD